MDSRLALASLPAPLREGGPEQRLRAYRELAQDLLEHGGKVIDPKLPSRIARALCAAEAIPEAAAIVFTTQVRGHGLKGLATDNVSSASADVLRHAIKAALECAPLAEDAQRRLTSLAAEVLKRPNYAKQQALPILKEVFDDSFNELTRTIIRLHAEVMDVEVLKAKYPRDSANEERVRAEMNAKEEASKREREEEARQDEMQSERVKKLKEEDARAAPARREELEEARIEERRERIRESL